MQPLATGQITPCNKAKAPSKCPVGKMPIGTYRTPGKTRKSELPVPGNVYLTFFQATIPKQTRVAPANAMSNSGSAHDGLSTTGNSTRHRPCTFS